MEVDDLIRSHAPVLHQAGFVQKGILPAVEHANLRAQQLPRIFVGGNDDDIKVFGGRLSRHGGDHVVRFPARHFQNRDAKTLQKLLDQRNLRPEIFRHLRPIRLVVVVNFISFARPWGIERADEVLRFAVADGEHVPRKAENGVCGLSLSPGHRRNSMEDLKHQRKCVDDVDAVAAHEENLPITSCSWGIGRAKLTESCSPSNVVPSL